MFSNNADFTMPVQPAYNGGCGNNAFGGDFAWWIVILLIFGWGNGGWGGMGNGNGALTRADMCGEFSFQDVKNGIRELQSTADANFRSIDNAVCTLGYNNAQLANGIQMQLANNFNVLDTSLCQLGNNIAQQFNGTNMAIMQGNNATQAQIASCCCENEKAAMQSRFDAAQNTCATLQAIEKLGDRIESKLTAQEIEAKNATIAAQNQQIFQLQLQASQADQNNYLVNQLSPKCPIPAFLTCNPYTGQTYTNGYGYGNSCCGCGA